MATPKVSVEHFVNAYLEGYDLARLHIREPELAKHLEADYYFSTVIAENDWAKYDTPQMAILVRVCNQGYNDSKDGGIRPLSYSEYPDNYF